MNKNLFIEKFNEEIAKSGIISKIEKSSDNICRYNVNDTESRIGLNIVNNYKGIYAVCIMPSHDVTVHKIGVYDEKTDEYDYEKENTSSEYSHAVNFISHWKNKRYNMLESCYVRNKYSKYFPQNDYYFQKDYNPTINAYRERHDVNGNPYLAELREFKNIPALCFYLEENREYSQEEFEILISEVYFVISSLRNDYIAEKQRAECFECCDTPF